MALEFQDLAWDRHKNVMGLNWLIGPQPSPLYNWISNVKTDTVKPDNTEFLWKPNKFLSPEEIPLQLILI